MLRRVISMSILQLATSWAKLQNCITFAMSIFIMVFAKFQNHIAKRFFKILAHLCLLHSYLGNLLHSIFWTQYYGIMKMAIDNMQWMKIWLSKLVLNIASILMYHIYNTIFNGLFHVMSITFTTQYLIVLFMQWVSQLQHNNAKN